MKKLLLLFTCLAVLFSYSNAFSVVTPASDRGPLASAIMLPIKGTDVKISLADLAVISPKDYAAVTGKKMNLVEKIDFKLSQKKLKTIINDDGTVNRTKLDKLKKSSGDFFGDFEISGFALGVFLSLVGVLIAYLIDDDKKQQRVKWAWLGFVVSLLLFGAFII
jgi:hypothetical protein